MNQSVAKQLKRMVERVAREVVLDADDGQTISGGEYRMLGELRVGDPNMPIGHGDISDDGLPVGGLACGHLGERVVTGPVRS